MELRRLRYFAVAAIEGSFHRASARLHIAQPALSRQIRDLEEELEVVLFVRSAQGVTLSPAGRVLLAEVERLLPQVELAKTRTRRAAMGQFGLLRIGFTPLAAELRFTIAAFAQARRTNPDVDFRLSLVDSDRQVEALVSGEIDVGLLYRRSPHPPGMAFQDLRTDTYSLVVPSGHPFASRRGLRLAELSEEDIIFVSKSLRPVTYNELMTACLRGGLSPRVILEVNSEAALLNMVAEGIAVGFTNSSLEQRRPRDGVVFVTLDDLDIQLQLAAIWERNRETPAILLFVDLLVQHLSAERGDS